MEAPDRLKIRLSDYAYWDEPIPYGLEIFTDEQLYDTSFYYLPDLVGFGWWRVIVEPYVINDFERVVDINYTVHPDRKQVSAVYVIGPWSPEEIETEVLRRIEVFKTSIYSFVRPRLDAFVATRRYENLNDCISYQNSNYPSIKAEADRAVELRDSYRMVMFGIIKSVEDRTIPIPTDAEIPNLNWPVLLWEVGPPIDPEIPEEGNP